MPDTEATTPATVQDTKNSSGDMPTLHGEGGQGIQEVDGSSPALYVTCSPMHGAHTGGSKGDTPNPGSDRSLHPMQASVRN